MEAFYCKTSSEYSHNCLEKISGTSNLVETVILSCLLKSNTSKTYFLQLCGLMESFSSHKVIIFQLVLVFFSDYGYLIFVLIWCSILQSGRFGKLNKRITFPETLDLSPYMSEAEGGSDIYKLYAVVVHLDMLNASYFGHYICCIKDFLGNWYQIDDGKVNLLCLPLQLRTRTHMITNYSI